jgi:hypothetical protein
MDIPGPLRFPCMALLCALTFSTAQPASAATISVRSGGDLQAAINAAQPGDVIELEAGATFVGNFLLPVKSGSTFITIRTAGSQGLPGADVRITPAHAPRLARIRSGNSMSALRTAPGAHHWRLLLLEFQANVQGYGEIIQIGDGSSAQNQPAHVPHSIEIDRVYIHGDPLLGQKRGIALNGAGITIRNSHIADIKAIGMDTQAIGGWNGPGPFTIENNYLEAAGENIMLGGADPSIPGLVSENVVVRYNHVSRPMSWRDPIVPTPGGVTAAPGLGGTLTAGTHGYRIVAQRRVGSGGVARSTASAEALVTVAAGGKATITWTAVPDATDYRVYVRTPAGATRYWTVSGTGFTDTGAAGTSGAAPTTIGDRWLVKNLFELKNARRVVVESNLFENNWAHGQAGYAILFTPRNQEGGCSWCVVEEVTFHANIVRNVAAGINILGFDDLAPSRQTANIRITQNLFHRVDRALGGNAWFVLIGRGPRAIVIDHNTIDANGSAIVYVSGGTLAAPQQVEGFQFTNNAARHNEYGINGADVGYGSGILGHFFPGAVFARNWLQGGPAARYPANNFFTGEFWAAFADPQNGDYRAVSGSVPWRQATDGSDIGASAELLARAAQSAASGPAAPSLTAPGNLRVLSKK